MSDLNRYYKILGIKVGTSQAEVKQAYRKLAKLWHPDRFSGDPVLQQQAEEKLKAINEAYQYLKDYQPSETPANRADKPRRSSQVSVSTKLTGAEKCYERAAEYGRAGQYKEALEELSVAIRLHPNYVEAYRYRGFVHSMLGFELGAEADLKKARDLEWEQAYAARQAKRQGDRA
jgi:curved DNA-binding protein CbpA